MAVPSSYINPYHTMFAALIIRPEKAWEIDAAVNKINAGKSRYEYISTRTGVPWYFIGIVHYRESTCNFSKHLHNGDPLTARTVQVPAGRPATGNAPFTFEESAIDALAYMGLTSWKDWSIPGMLYQLERYNGFGYRNYNVNSPYLWNYTQFYTKGLYVRDGVYDGNAVSKQAGAAAILRRVMEKNNLYKTVAALSIGAIFIIGALAYLLTQKNSLL